ncbi:MAG: GIY-YIG nuclease family protein [Butyricicoccus sp.]
MEIKLNDLLKFSEKDLKVAKIKFNQSSPDENPLDLYQKNPEIVNTQWLFWRESRHYFAVGQIAICFLKLTWDTWLLTTIKRITKNLDVRNGITYEGEELEEYKKYYGRVIVKFHKTFQTQGCYFETVKDELIVNQILPAVFDGYDFPGYDKVRLSYEQLSIIIKQNKKDWRAALENQKAVYLITDTNNGKLYVGSATSDYGMLLQRWSNYVENGHGGNVELRRLVEEKGFEYVQKHFQYSILENYNAKVDDHIILERESWWKDTLQSRKHGYNAN